jgi:DNA primase
MVVDGTTAWSTPMYIDFQELKARVSITDVADLLGLALTEHNDQLRGPCPRCQGSGERTLAITPERNAYYCFTDERGGDCIALAAHIRNCSMRDAALFIHEHLRARGADGDDTEPDESKLDTASTSRLQPLDYLLFEHEAVQALGIDPKAAEALGIGYAKKGIMRGRVAIPLRSHEGVLAGYCGYTAEGDPPLKLPKTLKAP